MFGEILEQLIGYGAGLLVAGEAEIFVLGQNAFEFGFVFLDGLHRLFERFGDVFFLGKFEQIFVTSMVG